MQWSTVVAAHRRLSSSYLRSAAELVWAHLESDSRPNASSSRDAFSQLSSGGGGGPARVGELSRELNEQVELIRTLLLHSHRLGALKREQLLDLLRSSSLDTSEAGDSAPDAALYSIMY